MHGLFKIVNNCWNTAIKKTWPQTGKKICGQMTNFCHGFLDKWGGITSPLAQITRLSPTVCFLSPVFSIRYSSAQRPSFIKYVLDWKMSAPSYPCTGHYLLIWTWMEGTSKPYAKSQSVYESFMSERSPVQRVNLSVVQSISRQRQWFTD